MTLDLKTLAVVVSFVGIIITGAMGYGSLRTEVTGLKEREDNRDGLDMMIAADITEMKTNIATLLERTKP